MTAVTGRFLCGGTTVLLPHNCFCSFRRWKQFPARAQDLPHTGTHGWRPLASSLGNSLCIKRLNLTRGWDLRIDSRPLWVSYARPVYSFVYFR